MTFSELKKKDIICIGDGRLIGRASDLMMDPNSGQILGAHRKRRRRVLRHVSNGKEPAGNPMAANRLHRGRCDSCFGERMRIK